MIEQKNMEKMELQKNQTISHLLMFLGGSFEENFLTRPLRYY